jgi:hypothetical protein
MRLFIFKHFQQEFAYYARNNKSIYRESVIDVWYCSTNETNYCHCVVASFQLKPYIKSMLEASTVSFFLFQITREVVMDFYFLLRLVLKI